MTQTFNQDGFVFTTDTSAEDIERISAASQAIVTAELGDQHTAVFFGVKSKGVSGDASTYQDAVIITCHDLNIKDRWGDDYHDSLARASNRITNEIPGVNHVVYEVAAFNTQA